MLNIINAVNFHLATVTLKGHVNDLQLQIYLMPTVYLQKRRGSLEDKVCFLCEKEAPISNVGML